MAKKLSLVAGVFAVIGLLAASSAFAATPTLSLTSLGGGSAEINISGDANASVIFYYSVSGSSGMQTTTLGSTDASGAFSTTVNGSSYGISSGASVYVVVDGQQSNRASVAVFSFHFGCAGLEPEQRHIGTRAIGYGRFGK